MFQLTPSRADQARNAASRTERLRRRSHEACERPITTGLQGATSTSSPAKRAKQTASNASWMQRTTFSGPVTYAAWDAVSPWSMGTSVQHGVTVDSEAFYASDGCVCSVKPQETASTREVYLLEQVFHDVDSHRDARRPRSEATPGAAPRPRTTNRDVHPLLTKKIIAY